jgi:hypothetical protein
MTITYTKTYSPDPSCYDPGSTIEQMAEIDMVGVKDDPFLWIDDPETHQEIKMEVVDQ